MSDAAATDGEAAWKSTKRSRSFLRLILVPGSRGQPPRPPSFHPHRASAMRSCVGILRYFVTADQTLGQPELGLEIHRVSCASSV